MSGAVPRGPIIVLDDDSDTVHVTTDVLSDEGYDVEGYVDPRAALERLKRPPAPSLAIFDYWMPEMNGAEVVQALRAEGVDFPVLVTTAGHTLDLDRAILLASGVTVVLRKPFGLRRLVKAIEGNARDTRAGAA